MSSPQDELDALKAQIAQLTARVYQLELKTGERPEARPQAPPAPLPGTMLQPPQQPSAARPPAPEQVAPIPIWPSLPADAAKDSADLEKKIGQYWLNRIGIIAMLIGVSYFLKYAFANNWIGPGGRVAIGLVAGIGLILWSERFRNQGHKPFSYSLKAIGIGTLYLSLWGAFQVYHLIPAAAAFVAMMIVTAATIALALTQDAELLASFAVAGGFATPILLSTGQNHEVVLFAYVCLLDFAILAMTAAKPWRRLLWGSFAGTILLYAGWYGAYYTDAQRGLTVLFAALFAAIFAAIPIVARHDRSTRFGGFSVTLTLLPLLNAAAFFLALYNMYQQETVTLTWYALGLAAIYLGISNGVTRRFPGKDTKFISLLHVSIAIAFLTIAIPLKLNAEWITIGWLIESAALLWMSIQVKADFLRYLAAAALTLGIFRLLVVDRFQTETLVWNMRFATYAIAIAVLGAIVKFGKQYASENEMSLLQLAQVTLNVLALFALTLEARDYFYRQLQASYRAGLGLAFYEHNQFAHYFSYSAIWLIYGAALMAIGFWKRSAFVRWQSLVLIAVTIVKVFLYDVAALQQGYRVLSFVALGAVLLAISFIYQRDWLKLSSRSPEKGAEKTQ
jgi:uncharacterized membrane protein